MSVVNTLIHPFGGGVTFLFGLAVTQVFDGFSHGVPAASCALDIVPLGFFVLIGYFATKGQVWAFIVGGIAYRLDGMIYIAFSNLVAGAVSRFHPVQYLLWNEGTAAPEGAREGRGRPGGLVVASASGARRYGFPTSAGVREIG